MANYRTLSLSTTFDDLMNQIDSTIKLSKLYLIRRDDSDPITNHRSDLLSYIGSHKTSTYLSDFESLWDMKDKVMDLSFPGSSFSSNLICQALYIEYSIGGDSEPGFLVLAEDGSNIELSTGHNLFKIDFRIHIYQRTQGGDLIEVDQIIPKISNIYSGSGLGGDNLIREEYGGDPGCSAYSLIGKKEDNKSYITKDSFYRYLINRTGSKGFIGLSGIGEIELDTYTQKIYKSIEISVQSRNYQSAYGSSYIILNYGNDSTNSWFIQILGLATYDEYLVVNGKPVKKIGENKTISIWDVPDVELIQSGTINIGPINNSLKIIQYFSPINQEITAYTMKVSARLGTKTIEELKGVGSKKGKTIGYRFGSSIKYIESNVLNFMQNKSLTPNAQGLGSLVNNPLPSRPDWEDDDNNLW